MLKYSKRNVIELSDWDELVEETYGRPYSFQQQDGCQPRGTWDITIPNEEEAGDFERDEIPVIVNGNIMGVSFQSWLERDPKERFFEKDLEEKLFWYRNFYPCIDMIANDLYKKGLIEAGEYTIDIDW